ncbi:hypothetical protein T12_2964 [Trichinella patagoniensis]|uniref:Uncharacterized protein n=1 Tax=Trichinella patagoniensis TaxID=990121 RepID=A0A0V1A1P1_9BILA|nr:hypothetical protein T12_2964 [Trichinella patagoniensis]
MYPRRIVKGLGKMHFFFCKAVLSAQWHLFISCATFLRKNFLTNEDAVRAKEFGEVAINLLLVDGRLCLLGVGVMRKKC